MIESLVPRGGVIVSGQALSDSPLHGPRFMAVMAVAARRFVDSANDRLATTASRLSPASSSSTSARSEN